LYRSRAVKRRGSTSYLGKGGNGQMTLAGSKYCIYLKGIQRIGVNGGDEIIFRRMSLLNKGLK
jgi:hypothetical protein